MTPTNSPITTAQDMYIQFSSCKTHKIRNVAAIINIELRFVPKERALRRSFIFAFSFVLTEKIPIIDRTIPTAAINIGAITALNCISISPLPINVAAPSAEVASIEPQ